MKNRILTLLLIISLFFIISTACNLTTVLSGGSSTPTPAAITIPDLNSPNTIPSGTSLTQVITQQQINEAIQEWAASQTDYSFSNVQVTLLDNSIQMSGNMEQNFISGDVSLTMVPYVSDSGELGINIIELNLGNMPVSQFILDTVASQIGSALNNALSAYTGGLKINTIEITPGQMTITASMP